MIFTNKVVLTIAVTVWALAVIGSTYLISSGAYMRF